MGLLDNAKDKFGDLADSMKDRYEELRSKEQTGDLDDKSREELQRLRERFEAKG